MSLDLTVTPAAELSAGLPQLYWDIKRLAGLRRPKDRETNFRTLDEAMDVISREDAISGWSPFLCQRFVMTACALAREALLAGTPGEASGPMILLTPVQRADLLCSFAAAAGQLPLMGKLQAGSVWVMTKLDVGPPLLDPEAARVEALAALRPLNLPTEEANDQVRAQIVLHVGRRIETGQRLTPEVEEVARQWCTELLERGQLVTILHRAARNLGVALAQQPVLSEQDRPREQRFRVTPPPTQASEIAAAIRPASVEAPTLWKAPEESSVQAQHQEYLACLLKLQALSRDKAGPITLRTAEGLYDLGPESDLGFASKAFYFAARELWKSYTQTGQAGHLDIARRAALLAFRGAPMEGERRERGGALYLWMNTQLPSLIVSTDLVSLISDAKALYAQQGCRSGEIYLRQGILEAHAGLSRQRATAGDAEGGLKLARQDEAVLRQMFEEYLRQSAAVNYRPSEDALAAWDYLFPSSGSDGRAANRPAVETLLADADFREVIRRGSPDGVQQFISDRYAEIKNRLRRRLDAQPSTARLLWPEGTIRNTRATDNKTPDPAFVEAHSLLDAGQFQEARLAFGRLAEQAQVRGAVNRPREICRNYEAFCWAKLGEPAFARNCLQELIAGGFPFPSAYWNYACCMAEEEKDSQLGNLVKGLERAPHMLILRGAIQLALELEDRQFLRHWLPCLVETEALVLDYFLNFPELGQESRDPPVLRLAQYVMDGVEPFMPDPADRELRSGEVNDFIGAMLDRRMDAAVDFWLRCREQEPSIRFRFDFWESKTDFLDAVKCRHEAAESFREEMRCRLNLIRSGKFKGPQIIFTTRKRLEYWLGQCMTPELRAVGHDLYQMVGQFERQSGNHPGLLPRVPRIHQYFREQGDVNRSAAAASPADDRNQAQRLQRPFGAGVLDDQPRGPDGSVVRLPDLLADSLDGGAIGIDPTASRSAFAVCVGFALEEEGQEPANPEPVRLKAARARLEDGTPFSLRDPLQEWTVLVSPDRMAVLTFEAASALRLETPSLAVIDLTFEAGGADHQAEPSEVTLTAQACPALPEQIACLSLPLEILDAKGVEQFLKSTFQGSPIVVLHETSNRIHELTAGRPEAVRQIAVEMLNRARAEKRPVLTPHDALAAHAVPGRRESSEQLAGH